MMFKKKIIIFISIDINPYDQLIEAEKMYGYIYIVLYIYNNGRYAGVDWTDGQHHFICSVLMDRLVFLND